MKVDGYMKKVQNILIKIMSFVFLCALSIIILFGTIENGILLTILSFVTIIIFVRKVKIKRFYLFLILFSLITKIGFVCLVKTPIMADFYFMLEASEKILVNDFSFLNDIYFNTWGYQLVNVFYQSIPLRVFNDVIILKILNSLYATIITVLIYLIVRKTTNENTGRVCSLLYAISIYPIYLNTVLGNQQLSLLLILTAIYIFLYKPENLKNIIVVGILIGLANLERPEGIIYILTIIGYLILTNDKLLSIVKKVVVLLLIFFTVTKLPSIIMIETNVNKIGLKNNDPEWKFLTGFNYNTNGKYDSNDEIYFRNPELERKVIKERMMNFSKLPNLFYQKIKIQWLYDDLDQSFNVQSTKQFSNKLMSIVVNYIKAINLVLIVLALYSFKRIKEKNKVILFFQINIIIYFIVYLLIEVHLRYYYNPQIAVFILSSLAISEILDYKCKKNKGKMKCTP